MRARILGVVSTVLLASVVGVGTARAQPIQRGFALDRLELSERGSEWFSADSLDLRGKLRPAIGVSSVWSHETLVAYYADGSYYRSLVRNQVFVEPSASLVLFDRVRVAALVPIGAYANGRPVTSARATFLPPSGHLGDIRLSADVRLFGVHGDAVTMAVGSALYLPTGTRESYTSDGTVRFAPRVSVAGDIGRFAYAAKGAFHYRPLDGFFDRTPIGNQVELAVAGGVRVLDRRLLIGPEVFASSVLHEDAFFHGRRTPVEAMLGAHYTFKDFRFGAGVGTGIVRGWGAPVFRGVLSAEWAPAFEEKKPAPPPPPPEPPPPPLLLAPPPVVLPPPPPPDRDSDLVPDDRDACPDVPGEANGDPLSNGCPADRDADGVYDKDDACPDAPGAADSDPKRNGCPLARVENGQIRIAEQVSFKSGKAEILRDSEMLLLAVASTLRTHPEITKVRVEGHSDSSGAARANKILSQQRAEAVVAALVKNGIDKNRLVAKGLGSTQPIESNLTDEGKKANRRVELHIVGNVGGALQK